MGRKKKKQPEAALQATEQLPAENFGQEEAKAEELPKLEAEKPRSEEPKAEEPKKKAPKAQAPKPDFDAWFAQQAGSRRISPNQKDQLLAHMKAYGFYQEGKFEEGIKHFGLP